MSTEEETPDPPVKGPPVAANPHRAGMAQRIVTILGQLRGIDETIDTLFGEMRFDATTEAQREGLRLVMDLLEEQRVAASALLLAAGAMMLEHPDAFGPSKAEDAPG